ncbi:MAG: glycosyltransferase family 2 protein [Myxococcota bacterium]
MSAEISLCLIARDEAAMIGPCLASARPLCSELIVVDTGSRDATCDIARAAGATVLEIPWRDDFAAARNASIAAARGDWVLVLDADERLTAESPARIRAVLAREGEDFDAGMLRLHDASDLDAPASDVLAGRARLAEPMYLPRLLRRTPDLAFEGVVHESVRAWSARHGHRQRDVRGEIIHYGAVPALRRAREKGARNVRLLETRRRRQPDDFTVYGYLAHEYLAAGDVAAAWTACEAGWAPFLAAGEDSSTTLRSVLRLFAARALLQLHRGDPEGARASCDAVARYEGPHPDVSFFRARAFEVEAARRPDRRQTLLAAAATHYRDALAPASTPVAQRYVTGGSTWCGATRLGTVELLRGNPAAAVAAFDRALRDAPDPTEADLGALEAAFLLRRSHAPPEEPAQHEARLASHCQAARPDAWLLAAVRAEARNDVDGFAIALGHARATSTEGYLAPHRHRLHTAAHASLLAYRDRPSPGPGTIGAATALMSGDEPAPEPPPGGLDPYDAPALRRLVSNLLRRERTGMVERLLTDAAEATLPGVRHLVRTVVVELGMSVEERTRS